MITNMFVGLLNIVYPMICSGFYFKFCFRSKGYVALVRNYLVQMERAWLKIEKSLIQGSSRLEQSARHALVENLTP